MYTESVGLDTLTRKISADTFCKTIFCNFCSYLTEIGATPVLQSDQRVKKTIKDFTAWSPKGLDEHQFYLGKHILQSQSFAFLDLIGCLALLSPFSVLAQNCSVHLSSKIPAPYSSDKSSNDKEGAMK